MSYQYEKEKPELFTPEGMDMFIKIRDTTFELIEEAGAARFSNMIKNCTGDTWTMMAAVDFMVEKGEIFEVTGKNVRGQDRIFSK